MPDSQRIPADMRADQRCINVDDLAGRDPRSNAGPDRALENPAKAFGTPALPDAGQARVIGQMLVQPVTNEPADRDVDRCLAHQPPVVDDTEQEAREHQS